MQKFEFGICGVHWTSWMCRLILFSKFENCSAISFANYSPFFKGLESVSTHSLAEVLYVAVEAYPHLCLSLPLLPVQSLKVNQWWEHKPFLHHSKHTQSLGWMLRPKNLRIPQAPQEAAGAFHTVCGYLITLLFLRSFLFCLKVYLLSNASGTI